MRRLKFLPSAENDLKDILDYIAEVSGSAETARRFTREIQAQCEKLASLLAMLGRARPELRPDIRSFSFKNYLIFFRYVGDEFEVVSILEGHRDIDAAFSERKPE